MITFSDRVFTIETADCVYTMFVNDEQRLCHGYFLPAGLSDYPAVRAGTQRVSHPYPMEFQLNVNHESLQGSHGVRYYYTSCAARTQFKKHKIEQFNQGERLIVTLDDPETGLTVRLYYEVWDNSPAIRRYTEVENTAGEPVIINHISSYMVGNYPLCGTGDARDLYLHSFKSHWAWEGEHHVERLADIGLQSFCCRSGFVVESTSTWVCQQYIPCFMLEDRTTSVYTAVQLEYSGCWRFELGAADYGIDNWFYMQGGMGNDRNAQWNKALIPGECFQSPAASLVTAQGDADDAFNQLHRHQATLLTGRSVADRAMPVIYNDWPFMAGDVTEDKIVMQLDSLKDCGIEVYVIDAGWFTKQGGGADGSWWDRAGHWFFDEGRFPNGPERLAEAIAERGLLPGIWCEIEAVGAQSAIYNNPDALMRRNGRFVENANRRFLNFASETGRYFADQTFERLIGYGFRYFKIDYNIDSAPGCDCLSETDPGQGLHAHRTAYYGWLDALRNRHPDIVIENCSSGGMRLEYGMLSRTDLASITDQADERYTGAILYNVTKAIHPSQCGLWSYLKDDMTMERYLFTLTNSMPSRMHISGDIVRHDDERRAVIRDAVAFYKRYRGWLANALTFHHGQYGRYADNDDVFVLELREQNNRAALLAAYRPAAEADSIVVRPRGLLSGHYRLSFFPVGEERVVSREELEQGILIELKSVFSSSLVLMEWVDHLNREGRV